MKKIFAVLLSALLITALLASCSAGSKSTADEAAYDNGGDYGYSYDTDEGYYEDSMEAPAAVDQDGGVAGETTSRESLTESNVDTTLGEKMIYSLYADIETTDFDATTDNVTKLMDQFGAFIESSSISGNSYYSNTTYRTAQYTIRVPVENFASLKGSLEVLGNVVNQNSSADNITAQFTDVQARLDTYETEEERLLSMLEKADTVEDMITIESRLSDVRYQIESLTATLRNWQNQVDYSSVTLYIEEVEELSEQVAVQRTYWQRMWDGLQSTFDGIGDFFKALFMFIIVALPVIIILGVIAVVVILIVRASKNRKAKKNNRNIEPKE